ncbi:MAG: four helix bundle protein [Prevotellaceae bacterium]|jgi:four helix bundle protein|nr:four helix bundle protein [Prevotellaceae bacterium]
MGNTDKGFKSLLAYQKAYMSAMEIFVLSKHFPMEERFSLTDQIRRSSRSVCANIAEAYRKRVYVKSYTAKLTDADSECSETIVWLNFAKDSGYITEDVLIPMEETYDEIGKLIGYMLNCPEKFGVKI